MVERRPLGFVEGFIVTLRARPSGEAAGLAELKALRDALRCEVWLRPQQGGEPLGKILAVEIRETLEGLGLWARLEIYDRAALKITAQGLREWLNLKPVVPSGPPSSPVEQEGQPLAPPEPVPPSPSLDLFQPPLPFSEEALSSAAPHRPSRPLARPNKAYQLALDL